MRTLTTRWIAPTLVALTLACATGCELYNRADISRDGRTLAFALNDKAAFDTDASSDIYLARLSDEGNALRLTRRTRNRRCDAWTSLAPDGKRLLSVSAPKKGGFSINAYNLAGGPSGAVTGLSRPFACCPVALDEGRFLFAYLRTRTDGEHNEIVFVLIEPAQGETSAVTARELATVPSTDDHHIWSTTPAVAAGHLYYAVGRILDQPAHTSEAHEKTILLVTLHSVDLRTGARRDVAELPFVGDPEQDMPVGIADLAVSPDGRTLLCCFLPGSELRVDTMDDRKPSLVYAVNLAAPAPIVKRLGHAYMYYPRFANYPQFAATPDPIDPDSPAADAESWTPRGEVVFLSGAGYGDDGGRSVYRWDLGERVTELARFPDKVMTAYTGWTWLDPARLRIFHLSDRGLELVDVNHDGSGKVVRHADRQTLRVLKREADARSAAARFRRAWTLSVRELTELRGLDEPLEFTSPLSEALNEEAREATAGAADVWLADGPLLEMNPPTRGPLVDE